MSDDLATLLRMDPVGWEGVQRMIRAGELLNEKADELKRTERGALKDWLDERSLSKTKAHRARYVAANADLLAKHKPESVNEAIRQINGRDVKPLTEAENWTRQFERLMNMAPAETKIVREGDKITVTPPTKSRPLGLMRGQCGRLLDAVGHDIKADRLDAPTSDEPFKEGCTYTRMYRIDAGVTWVDDMKEPAVDLTKWQDVPPDGLYGHTDVYIGKIVVDKVRVRITRPPEGISGFIKTVVSKS